MAETVTLVLLMPLLPHCFGTTRESPGVYISSVKLSETEKRNIVDSPYMRTLKEITIEMNLFTKRNGLTDLRRMNLEAPKAGRMVRRTVREFGRDMHTLLRLRWNKDPLRGTGSTGSAHRKWLYGVGGFRRRMAQTRPVS